ncbi:TPA: hypothetical protein ACSPFR_000999 [Enterococcus faecium]
MLKTVSKIVVATLGVSIIGSTVVPTVTASAAEVPTSTATTTNSTTLPVTLNQTLGASSILDQNDFQNFEIIGIDENGNEHILDPNSPNLRYTSSIIYIDVKIRYTSTADGKNLIAMFNKTYGMGAIGDAIAIFSSALGGIPGSIVGGFVGLGFNGFRSRCKESITAVQAHPSGGAIYMYLDHVTWKAS